MYTFSAVTTPREAGGAGRRMRGSQPRLPLLLSPPLTEPGEGRLQVVEGVAHVALGREDERLEARRVPDDALRGAHVAQAPQDLLRGGQGIFPPIAQYPPPPLHAPARP